MNHVLDDSYQALDPDVAIFYRSLGMLPLDGALIDAGMAAAACGLDPAATDDRLAVLTRHDLVRPDSPDHGRYRFSTAALRRHAARLSRSEDSEAWIELVRRRSLDWLVAEADAAARHLDPLRRRVEPHLLYPPAHRARLTTATEARQWFGLRGSYLGTALEWAELGGLDGVTAHLVHACMPWLVRRRDLALWQRACEAAVPAAQRLAAAAPRPGASRLLLGQLFSARATVRRILGDHVGAIEDCHAGLALAQDDHDTLGQAQHLHDLGACALATGAVQLAWVYLRQAVDWRTELGDRRGGGLSRVVLALAHRADGDTDTALEGLRTAHGELTAVGDAFGAARARAWQGRILACRGKFVAANEALADALNAFLVEEATGWQARTLLWTGESAGGQGREDVAAEMLRRSYRLYEASPFDRGMVSEAAQRLGISL